MRLLSLFGFGEKYFHCVVVEDFCELLGIFALHCSHDFQDLPKIGILETTGARAYTNLHNRHWLISSNDQDFSLPLLLLLFLDSLELRHDVL